MKTPSRKITIVFLMNLMLSLSVNAITHKDSLSNGNQTVLAKDPVSESICMDRETEKKPSLHIVCAPMDKNGSSLSGIEIALLKDNVVLEKREVTDEGEIKNVVFNSVSKNSSYSVRIFKEGYLPMIINVSTEVLDMKKWTNTFVYEFELELSASNDTDNDVVWVVR